MQTPIQVLKPNHEIKKSTTKFTPLSLHERQIRYYKKRNEIFGETKISPPSPPKILTVRQKFKEKKKMHKAIESTTLCETSVSDDKAYLNV